MQSTDLRLGSVWLTMKMDTNVQNDRSCSAAPPAQFTACLVWPQLAFDHAKLPISLIFEALLDLCISPVGNLQTLLLVAAAVRVSCSPGLGVQLLGRQQQHRFLKPKVGSICIPSLRAAILCKLPGLSLARKKNGSFCSCKNAALAVKKMHSQLQGQLLPATFCSICLVSERTGRSFQCR